MSCAFTLLIMNVRGVALLPTFSQYLFTYERTGMCFNLFSHCHLTQAENGGKSVYCRENMYKCPSIWNLKTAGKFVANCYQAYYFRLASTCILFVKPNDSSIHLRQFALFFAHCSSIFKKSWLLPITVYGWCFGSDLCQWLNFNWFTFTCEKGSCALLCFCGRWGLGSNTYMSTAFSLRITFALYSLVYYHTTVKTPVLVPTLKLSPFWLV